MTQEEFKEAVERRIMSDTSCSRIIGDGIYLFDTDKGIISCMTPLTGYEVLNNRDSDLSLLIDQYVKNIREGVAETAAERGATFIDRGHGG